MTEADRIVRYFRACAEVADEWDADLIHDIAAAIRAGAHERGPAPDGSFPGDAIVRRELGFSWDSCRSAG